MVASGNGGSKQDNCNFDGYANSIYTVTIGAVDEFGQMPYYAEECASMLGVTFSSGYRRRDIVTTDWTHGNAHGCTDGHTGTSAAAPIAAGLIALMLGARPCLSWRDVQYILVLTAQRVDEGAAHWQKNGAGLHHSHQHGFGLLTAWRMVNAAHVWETVPWMTSFSVTGTIGGEGSGNSAPGTVPKMSRLDKDKFNLPSSLRSSSSTSSLVVRHVVSQQEIDGYGLSVLESVQVTVWLQHPYRGKLGIRLISPSGTVSVIAAPR